MENGIVKGRAVIVGDNMTSDIIIPEKYVEIKDLNVLGDRCFEGITEDFSPYFPADGIIVAGRDFGIGTNRDYPCIAIIRMGAKAIIAESFSRMFYRNAINLGLVIVECSDCTKNIKHKDVLTIDIEHNTIKNETTGKTLNAKPIFTAYDRNRIVFNALATQESDSETESDSESDETEDEHETTTDANIQEDMAQEALKRIDELFNDDFGYDDIMLDYKKRGIKSMRQLKNEEIARKQGVAIEEHPAATTDAEEQSAAPDAKEEPAIAAEETASKTEESTDDIVPEAEPIANAKTEESSADTISEVEHAAATAEEPMPTVASKHASTKKAPKKANRKNKK
ncbi:MAG TPA: hypothetical protein DCO86_05360 [Spirochaetaceae bacterium]|nr:hypothetical protein [Spirochaetaceae bacterium]